MLTLLLISYFPFKLHTILETLLILIRVQMFDLGMLIMSSNLMQMYLHLNVWLNITKPILLHGVTLMNQCDATIIRDETIP